MEQKNNPFVDKVEGILDYVTKELVAQATVLQRVKYFIEVLEGKEKECGNAEKLPNGQCRGFQISRFENCPECDWSDNDEWVQRQVDYDD